MDDADERLLRCIMYNREHVLQPFLSDRPVLSHNLLRRPHCNKSLITKTADLSNNDYIIRATYRQLLTLLLTKQSYHFTLSCFTHPDIVFSQLYYGCICKLFNKREMMMMMMVYSTSQNNRRQNNSCI